MVQEPEGTFEIGGAKLYTKSWIPEASPPKATLVFIHGYSDHVNRYDGLFRPLAERGIATHGFDQRGWGRSVTRPSDRGNTGPTAQILEELASFIRQHLPSKDGAPVFVLGHSMGGGLAIALASDPRYADLARQIRGWLLEAPLVGMAPGEEPGALKLFFGRLAMKWLPRQQLTHQIAAEKLCRVPEVVADLKADKLCHDMGTLECLGAMVDRMEALSRGETGIFEAGGPVRSLWVGHGTDDATTGMEPAKKWYDRQGGVGDRTFKEYKGFYHQLHADYGCEEFINDVGEWILERAGGEGEGKGLVSVKREDVLAEGAGRAPERKEDEGKSDAKL